MHWFTDSLIHWFIGSCFVASFIHWFIDSLIRRIIGSLVHWFIRLVVPGFFHVISLAPQPPFRWCTSQLQHLVASASQKKHRPLISYSHFIFSKLPPAQAGHYLLSRNAGYSNIEGFPAKKREWTARHTFLVISQLQIWLGLREHGDNTHLGRGQKGH
jgi:hypothetical protein